MDLNELQGETLADGDAHTRETAINADPLRARYLLAADDRPYSNRRTLRRRTYDDGPAR